MVNTILREADLFCPNSVGLILQSNVFMLPIFFLLLCSVSALNKLREFDNSSSLGLKYAWQKYLSGEKGAKYSLIMPIVFITSGVIVVLLKE